MAVYQTFQLLLTDFINIEGSPATLGITQIVCALICQGKDGCSSFFYHADEMSCVPSLTRHFNPNGLVSGTGYKYYIARPECDEGWEVFLGRCYYYESRYMTQNLAKAFCVGMGAILASTNSAAEDVYFRSLTQRGLFWLGGEKGADQTWFWLDGGQFVARWADSQPDGDGACLEQWGTGWNDAYCGSGLRPLCEK